MRRVLNSISMDGIVVIGEGEKDEVPRYQTMLISIFVHLAIMCRVYFFATIHSPFTRGLCSS